MGDYQEILRYEFSAEFEGDEPSFLIQLHFNKWDKVAFYRLVRAMWEACEATEGTSKVERWMAFGFFNVFQITTSWWTDHPHVRRIHSEEY